MIKIFGLTIATTREIRELLSGEEWVMCKYCGQATPKDEEEDCPRKTYSAETDGWDDTKQDVRAEFPCEHKNIDFQDMINKPTIAHNFYKCLDCNEYIFEDMLNLWERAQKRDKK